MISGRDFSLPNLDVIKLFREDNLQKVNLTLQLRIKRKVSKNTEANNGT